MARLLESGRDALRLRNYAKNTTEIPLAYFRKSSSSFKSQKNSRVKISGAVAPDVSIVRLSGL